MERKLIREMEDDMESIETLTKLERRPWRIVAVVGVLMLLVAWRILSVMATNAPIGGYGDFSDTDYGDVDWDRGSRARR